MTNAWNSLKITLVKFHNIELLLPPPPGNFTWAGQLNMGKKIKNAWNGLKMILAKFHHVELPPTPAKFTYTDRYPHMQTDGDCTKRVVTTLRDHTLKNLPLTQMCTHTFRWGVLTLQHSDNKKRATTGKLRRSERPQQIYHTMVRLLRS